MRRGTTAAAAAALALVILVLPAQRPAAACSCAERGVAEALATADAVAVVTALPTSTATTLVLQVDRTVAGQLPSVLQLPAGDGASCGLTLPVGGTTALGLERDGLGWTAGLCSQLDVAAVLAAVEPLPVGEAGAPALVAAGPFGDAGLVLLDGAGRPLRWADGIAPTRLAACDGELLETGSVAGGDGAAALRWRTLPDLQPVHEVPLPHPAWSVVDVSCRPAEDGGRGAVVLVAEPDDRGLHVGRVLVVAGDEVRALVEAPFSVGAAGGGAAYVVTTSDEPEWDDRRDLLLRVDLASGEVTSLRPLGPFAAESVAVSPDGATVAVAGYARGEGGGSEYRTFDAATGAELGRARGADGASVRLAWVDGDTLLVRTPDVRGPALLVARDLSVLAEVADPGGWLTTVASGALYTAGGSRLRAVALDGAAPQPVALGPLHLASATTLLGLGDGPRPDWPDPEPTPAPEVASPDPGVRAAASPPWTGTAAAVAVLASLGAVGAAVVAGTLLARRRRSAR